MSSTEEINVYGYSNNGPKGCRPRRPLVHIIATSYYADVASMSFHPDEAPAVIEAIKKAAAAAKAGRDPKPITIKIKEEKL